MGILNIVQALGADRAAGEATRCVRAGQESNQEAVHGSNMTPHHTRTRHACKHLSYAYAYAWTCGGRMEYVCVEERVQGEGRAVSTAH